MKHFYQVTYIVGNDRLVSNVLAFSVGDVMAKISGVIKGRIVKIEDLGEVDFT